VFWGAFSGLYGVSGSVFAVSAWCSMLFCVKFDVFCVVFADVVGSGWALREERFQKKKVAIPLHLLLPCLGVFCG